MRPVINKNLLTFYDLYEFWDNEPEEGVSRAGFKQQWEASPFYTDTIAEEYVEEAYNRLLARNFTRAFCMLDERQIHLNIFKGIKDFIPNLIKRREAYQSIYNTELEDLRTKLDRTNRNTSTGTNNISDTGYENQAQGPNTQGSPEEPILDMISAQRNKNFKQELTDNRDNDSKEVIVSGVADAYQIRLNAIVDGLWDELISKFDRFFPIFYSGIYDYMYRNEIEGDE